MSFSNTLQETTVTVSSTSETVLCLVMGLLATIGGIITFYYVLKLTWRCWCGLRPFLLSEIWRVDLKKYGQWAVVTGATAGIGKAYAIELASRGLDVVLISRSTNKLHMVAKEIEVKYGRKTRIIQADFTEGHGIYPAIADGLQGLEIGILVNNVGMIYADNFAYFHDIPHLDQKITQLINCNALSVPQMTRLVLPGMVERGTGLIINISSEAGTQPQPLLSLYSASKVFVTYLSQSLHSEYKSKGITVQCVSPVVVSTNMTRNLGSNLLIKTAPDFACEALNTVGYSSYTSGCLSHTLQHGQLQYRSVTWCGTVGRLALCDLGFALEFSTVPITQHFALSILLPKWIRLSSFFVNKLLDNIKQGSIGGDNATPVQRKGGQNFGGTAAHSLTPDNVIRLQF